MDTEHQIEDFAEIGMTDPLNTAKSFKDAIQMVQQFDFYTEVYPTSVMNSILEAITYEASI